ncbi:ribosyldihydronicotinamide dehydrogenase [quinone]-like [Rhynchocyon petersi]
MTYVRICAQGKTFASPDLSKKVLIVYAHQHPSALDSALKTAAEDELSRQGCHVMVSYMGCGVEVFDACKRKSLARDITDEQKKVQEADLVIFQFPLHLFSVPAVMRGWMDKVLSQGFAYENTESGRITLLKGKLAISVTRGNQIWNDMKDTDTEDPLAYLWPLPHGVLHLCGFKVLAPQISSAPEFTSEEEQMGMVESWTQRLKTIWIEEPIKPRCTYRLL